MKNNITQTDIKTAIAGLQEIQAICDSSVPDEKEDDLPEFAEGELLVLVCHYSKDGEIKYFIQSATSYQGLVHYFRTLKTQCEWIQGKIFRDDGKWMT